MFKLEIIDLINKYKKAEEYDKQKIEDSIISLIRTNKTEFSNFIGSEQFNTDIEELLNRCYEKSSQANVEESDDDISIVRKQYENWLNHFVQNGRVANVKCEEVIENIIDFYIINRFEVLQEILKIKDSSDFEFFKAMLNNYIRKYFAGEIKKYYESESFNTLGYFSKKKKEREIESILNQIADYNFDQKKIEEVLQ